MSKEFEQQVRERAEEIWEQEGRSGDPQAYWARAEQEIAGAMMDKDKSSREKTAEDKALDDLADFA
jgi:hypothetical protein